MPDVHSGIGATVGSVIPTTRRDHPGRGRRRHRLRHDGGAHDARRRATCRRPRARCARAIERAVPHGRTDHGGRSDRGAWGDAAAPRRRRRGRRSSRATSAIVDKHPKLGRGNDVDAPRHARHRQPLHRGLPRRGGPRLVHAAQRLARRRQPHRHATSSSWRKRGHARAARATCRTRTSRTCREGTTHFDDYVEAVALGAGLRARRTAS